MWCCELGFFISFLVWILFTVWIAHFISTWVGLFQVWASCLGLSSCLLFHLCGKKDKTLFASVLFTAMMPQVPGGWLYPCLLFLEIK